MTFFWETQKWYFVTMVLCPYTGSQWRPVLLERLFKISPVVLCRTKKVVQVWNHMKVSKWRKNLHFWVTFLYFRSVPYTNILNYLEYSRQVIRATKVFLIQTFVCSSGHVLTAHTNTAWLRAKCLSLAPRFSKSPESPSSLSQSPNFHPLKPRTPHPQISHTIQPRSEHVV